LLQRRALRLSGLREQITDAEIQFKLSASLALLDELNV
jgi:hypothetical protein